MKKLSFTILLLAFFATILSAQAIDQPLVKVEYDSVDVITKKMVETRMEQNRQTLRLMKQDDSMVTKELVVDSLIKELLLLQGAKSAKISVNESEINNYVNNELKQQKQMMEQRLNKKLSDTEFNKLLSDMGVDIGEFKNNYRRMQTIKSYVEKEKRDFIQNYPRPTEADALKMFNKMVQAGQLIKPVYTKIGHIFFNTQQKKYAQMQEIRSKAVSVQKDIVSGKISFINAVKQYSDDKSSAEKNGLLGWTGLTDPALITLFGTDTASEIVDLKKGATSAVLESESGFHIVYVFDRQEGGIPKFTDKRFPENSDTFKDYFMEVMNQSSAEQAFSEAMESLYNELLKEATITYYDKGLKK